MGLTKVFMPDMVTGTLPFSQITGACFNVVSYGAVSGQDSTTAFQAALAAAAATTRGGVVYVPEGNYTITTTLTLPKKVTIKGDGYQSSILTFTNTGDGILDSSPINSSVGVYTSLRDIGLYCSNGSNTGGGYDNIGGTYVYLDNVAISGFKYGVILDQSELVNITNCNFTGNTYYNTWLVNGPEHVYTTSVSGVSTGSQTVTPTDMSIITACWNQNGAGATYMWAQNADGSNGETVQVTAVTSTTFTATFATSKSANFVIGARPGFTNRISISTCQYNFGNFINTHIQDNGGGNHSFCNNNINAGNIGIWAAGVNSLTIQNNEMEGCATYSVYLGKDPHVNVFTNGFSIQNNAFGGGAVSVYLDQCENGNIKSNVFYQFNTIGISRNNPDYMSDVEISNNSLITYGQGRSNLPLFDDGQLAEIQAQGKVTQGAQTWVSSALASTGSQTITPISMQFISIGSVLQCRNTDGTNIETVTVTGTTGSTFTATFASTKSAGWVINGFTGS